MTRVKLNRRNIRRLAKSGPVTRGIARGVAAGARGAARRAPVATGHLRDSYDSWVEPGYGRFGTDVDYAVHQELGTRYKDAQPHARPAIDDAIQAIKETRP
jgi:hypothetical protein